MVKTSINEPFLTAFNKVKDLQKYDRYESAYIFGSVARGEQDKNSDLDVMVIVDSENDCKEINHPIVNGVKLDLSFRSFNQIKKMNDEVVEKGERIPFIAESIIIFDKTGGLTKLKRKLSKTKRKKATKDDFQFMQFMIYHSDNKAKRNLNDDKLTALLSMDININEMLKYHYHINGKWWISNKRLLSDLREWDPKLARILQKFVETSDVKIKYRYWSQILDHIAKPIGGRKEIKDINCNCKVCRKDLDLLVR